MVKYKHLDELVPIERFKKKANTLLLRDGGLPKQRKYCDPNKTKQVLNSASKKSFNKIPAKEFLK